MRIDLPDEIEKKQWLERLGVEGEADGSLKELMQLAERKLLSAAMPQGVFKIMPKDGAELPGKAIKNHLSECSDMVIMAVTLGAGIDRLIRTAQVRDMAEAVTMDAGASVLAEQIADVLTEEIRNVTGGYVTSRYSPGYGDFPVEVQRKLINSVDGPRTIGLTVNESHILVPRKSITAIIGAADHPVKGHLATCEECAIKESCKLRKEGKQCWT